MAMGGRVIFVRLRFWLLLFVQLALVLLVFGDTSLQAKRVSAVLLSTGRKFATRNQCAHGNESAVSSGKQQEAEAHTVWLL